MNHQKFRSFEEYAAAIQHADVRMTLTGKDQWNWGLSHLALSDVSVQWGGGGAANACEGSSVQGGLTLFVPMQNSNSAHRDKQCLLGDGQRLENGSVMILEPGVEFCIAATGAHRWSSIFVPFDVLTLIHGNVKRPEASHHFLAPSSAGQKLRLHVERLAEILRDTPGALRSTSGIRRTKLKITEAVAKALGCNSAGAAHSGRPTVSRSWIVRTALNVVEEYPEEHMSVWQLSNVIGISERTLRNAFEEYFGVGPSKYLRVRALREARKLLKAADPSTSGVTKIAVRLGIWDFGRFARDYKILFGESPSETLRE